MTSNQTVGKKKVFLFTKVSAQHGAHTPLQRWSGGAMALGKFAVSGRPTNLARVGQGPIALAVGAGGGCFGHFFSDLPFLFSFSLPPADGPI